MTKPVENLNRFLVREGDWILDKDHLTGEVFSMRLCDEAYERHFGIVDNFHGFLNKRGYVVTPKTAKALEYFMEDNLYDSFAYLVGACGCIEKSLAEDVIKWMTGPLREVMNERGVAKPINIGFHAPDFGMLVKAVVDKRITATMGKEVLRLMADGQKLDEILEMDKFKVASDDDLIAVIKSVMAANPQQVEQAKADPKLIGWIIGQVMKASGGKANAASARVLIEKELAE